MVKHTQSQTGSAHVAIIIVVVLTLLGTLGFVFWQNFIKKDQVVVQTKSPSATDQGSIDKDANLVKFDTSIHDVDIEMKSSSDLNRLPAYTPASFKTYMQQLLIKNTSGPGMFDCGTAVVEYQISKISQVNIEGGTVPVNEQGETCSGGAPAIWVLTPKGAWDQETRNGILCSSKNGGLVYEEFASECSADGSTFVKNPNGSILSLGE